MPIFRKSSEHGLLRDRIATLERELATLRGAGSAARWSDEQLRRHKRLLELARTRRRRGELRDAVTQQLQLEAALRRLLARAADMLRKKLLHGAIAPRPSVSLADAERVRCSLFAALEAQSHDVDCVLEDTGLARCATGELRRIRIGALSHHPRASGVGLSCNSSDGGLFVEVAEMWVLPFSVQETSATMWEFFCRGSKSMYSGAYTTLDAASSELFGCYGAACVWNSAPHEISGAVAMRRIDELSRDRVVNVWSSRSTLSPRHRSSENHSPAAESSLPPPLLCLHECGWSALEPLAVAPGDAGPVAALKMCTRVTLSQHEAPAGYSSHLFSAAQGALATQTELKRVDDGRGRRRHQQQQQQRGVTVLLDECTRVESSSSTGDPSRAATLSEFAIRSQARDSRFFLRALESALVGQRGG